MNMYLRISLLSEYTYCPRAFAYHLINYTPLEEDNFYIQDGRLVHGRFENKRERYNREGFIEKREVVVHSEKLEISGKVDRLLLKNETLIIIEEKRGKIRQNVQHVAQGHLLAYCLSEMYPKKKIEIKIYYNSSRRNVDIEWSSNLKEKTEQYVIELRKKISSLCIKNFIPVRDGRCYGCMFQEICGD